MTTLLDSLAGPPVGEDANADHRAAGGPGGPDVEVVVPVYNEETDLGPSVRRLYAYLSTAFPFTWRITIADNASIDTTPVVAQSLAEELPGVRVVRLDQKGRGRALRHIWLDTDASVVAYMDVSPPIWPPCCRSWRR